MLEISLLSLFLTGLLGGVHCLGMCGGIVAALSMQQPGTAPPLRHYLAYNLGRIASYAAAGALAGLLGSGSLLLQDMLPVRQGLYAVANLLLIALGLYLAGLWQGVTVIERAGGRLWRRLQPLTGQFLPVRSSFQALALGALWGWLPCGLVYSVLIAALASGSAAKGALVMLVFGLGTLPNLLAMGLFARRLQLLLQQLWLRRAAGLLVAGFGALGLIRLVRFAAA
ncbi:MAG: sulfite exporter TauE/SafE family protein [Sulfuricellaceae bacterium]|nr:sulfite exporter TauE/SafE family protein [Sulfuricellaceae bacterium]